MRATRTSARTILVSASLVVVSCLNGQMALAQTASLGAPISAAAEQTLLSPQSQNPNFFESTFNDFKHLGTSKETLGWLGIGALAATLTHPADARVTTTMSAARIEQVRAGNTIGGQEFQFGASLAAFTFGKISGNDRVADVAGKVLRAQIMSQAVTHVIKQAAQRTRPDGSDGRSFPSGHTSVSFASATVLQREFGWKVGIPAYAVATYVGSARIEQKKHFLSDVAMGAAIGIMAGRTVTVGSGEKKFAVVPVATPGGAAVNFNWVGK